jgi:hypothetical protein
MIKELETWGGKKKLTHACGLLFDGPLIAEVIFLTL